MDKLISAIVEAQKKISDANRSAKSSASIRVPRRAGLRRDSDRKFRKIFAAAKFCVRNRARSRRNPHRLATPCLATSRKGL